MAFSPAAIEQRRALAPRSEFPPELPICARREEIAKAIASRQVVIVCGETGSGKTTQLPKICLELGRGNEGLIGHTQPRRIAARATAARVAQELKTELGGAVGYKIRFTDKVGPRSYIKIMTDGILLAETQGDRELRQYDTLIIDEAHDRSLNIDFLLGYVKQLLPRRTDLKLVITSATIDAERFSKHFDGAPVIEVSGRLYPVDTGLARVKRYSYRNKVEQLRVENISQASAKQRAGRCGRVASGVCVRLYADEEFNSRPAFTDPEVLRSSLASVILRMKSLGLGTVEEFPFIDSPASKAIQDGYALLAELGAVDEANELTEIGRQLAKLPVDPRVGRMVLAAKSENALREVLVIAAE